MREKKGCGRIQEGPCEHRGRDWRDRGTSQGAPGDARSCEGQQGPSPGAFSRRLALRHCDFGFLASRTGRKCVECLSLEAAQFVALYSSPGEADLVTHTVKVLLKGHAWFSSHLPACTPCLTTQPHTPGPTRGQPSAGFSSPPPSSPTHSLLRNNPNIPAQPRLQCPTSWSSRSRSLLAPTQPPPKPCSSSHTPHPEDPTTSQPRPCTRPREQDPGPRRRRWQTLGAGLESGCALSSHQAPPAPQDGSGLHQSVHRQSYSPEASHTATVSTWLFMVAEWLLARQTSHHTLSEKGERAAGASDQGRHGSNGRHKREDQGCLEFVNPAMSLPRPLCDPTESLRGLTFQRV